MSATVIVGTAAVSGLIAVLATGWLQRLARTPSPWIGNGLHPLLASLGGAGAAWWAQRPLELVALACVALACSLLIVVDVASHRLPNAIISPAYPLALGPMAILAAVDRDYSDLLRAVLAGLALAAGYVVLALISPTGLGLGDVKLAGLLGVVLGWYGWAEVLTGTIAAFIIGGLIAVVLLLTTAADRKTRLAFGPWMIAGAVVGLAWGPVFFGA